MKPIKLTEKQKEKLLEMCNKLFPGRTWQFWESDDENYPKDQMIGNSNTYNIGGKHYPALEIHWFEFCVIYLLPKIQQKHYYQQGTLFSNVIWDKINIIDDLYSQFKLIKLTK
jgi:hypothetical protein